MCAKLNILCAQRPPHQLNTGLGSLLAHLETSRDQNGHQLRCRFEDFTGELRLARGWALVRCRLSALLHTTLCRKSCNIEIMYSLESQHFLGRSVISCFHTVPM